MERLVLAWVTGQLYLLFIVAANLPKYLQLDCVSL